MSNKANDKYSVLKSLTHEIRKTFVTFDVQSRISITYEAKSDAIDGDPCLRTEYIYTGPASTVIKGVKETNWVWDGTWDAEFTT